MATQVLDEGAGVVFSGQLFADDVYHRGLGPVGDHFYGVHQQLAAGFELLELVLAWQVVPFDVLGCLFDLLFDGLQVVFEVFDLLDELGLFAVPSDNLLFVTELGMELQIGEVCSSNGELGGDRATLSFQGPPDGVYHLLCTRKLFGPIFAK